MMDKSYQDIINKVVLPWNDVKEAKKRHEFESVQISRDSLDGHWKPSIDQMR
jgi:hypothetical protein